ncbi:MAG: nuclear transport factor 2 family protein [Pseudonocardiaceae bacterium]
MTESAAALVERMYDCFNKGDLDTLRNEVFAQDVICRVPGWHPLGRVYHGIDELLALFRQATAGHEMDHKTIDTFGNDAAIELRRSHEQTEVATVDVLNCTMYRIKGGKIAEVHVFVSNQYAQNTFSWVTSNPAPIPARLGQ